MAFLQKKIVAFSSMAYTLEWSIGSTLSFKSWCFLRIQIYADILSINLRRLKEIHLRIKAILPFYRLRIHFDWIRVPNRRCFRSSESIQGRCRSTYSSFCNSHCIINIILPIAATAIARASSKEIPTWIASSAQCRG